MLQAGALSGVIAANGATAQNAAGIIGIGGQNSMWNALDMGVPRDGTYCADQLEAAVAKIEADGGGTLFLPAGIYPVERSVSIPLGVSLHGASSVNVTTRQGDRLGGQGTVIKPVADGHYINDFVFYMNVDPQNRSTWITAYPHLSCSIRNLIFDARGTLVGRNGFYFAGTYEFADILAIGVSTLIEKPPRAYTDGVIIRQIHATNTRADGDNYLINLPGLGDGYVIDGIASGYQDWGRHMSRGVYLGPVRGGRITNLINGRHKFEGGVYDISSLHLEGGDVEISDPMGGRLGESYFATEEEENAMPVIFSSKNAHYDNRYAFTVENNVFSRTINRRGGWPKRQISDVVTHAGVSLVLSNNHRRYIVAGRVKSGQVHGITLSDETGGMMSRFNQYSHVLSRRTVYITENRISFDPVYIPAQLSSISGLVKKKAKKLRGAVFTAANASYYYNAIVFLDPVRKAGRYTENAEISIAGQKDGPCLALGWDWGEADFRGDVMIRLYRGTRSGAYDHYVDLPVITLAEMVDAGHAINGFLWLPRSEGGMEAVNTGLIGDIVMRPGTADLTTMGGSLFWETGGLGIMSENTLNPFPSKRNRKFRAGIV